MLRDLFPDLPPERASHLYRHIPIAQPTGSSGAGLWRHTRVTRLALVGTLQPGKGQKVALRAVQRLENQGHAVELLLAGTGRPDYQNEIQALIDELGIADRVSCIGHVADPYPVIAAADIVLICSRAEGFCRVAVEAMLLGRAVVYPNTAGPADFMIDGQTGLAYPTGDDQALARCISDLIADPVRRIGLGQRGRQHAEQLFSPASYGGKAYLTLKRLRDQGRTDRSTGSSFLAALESAEAAELEAMRSVFAEQCSARDEALRRQVSQRLGQLQSGLLSFLNAGCTARSAVDPSGLGARLALVFWKAWLRLGLPANTWRRRWPDLQAIFLSGLFDEAFYRAVHPDLEAGVEPILHYLDQGGFQGRDPNPFFDSDWYLEKNPDVAAAGVNPLLHYIRHGAAERRSCHRCFDPSWYLKNNPDVAAVGVDPLAHSLHPGWMEGRTL